MRTTITAQQMAFFTQNGYIELEGVGLETQELFAHARKALGKKTPPPESHARGRDLWRKDPLLEKLFKKLSHTAFALTRKQQLRIGCDQWISSDEMAWEKPGPFKELFNIQGFSIGFILCERTVELPEKPPLGILPIPSSADTILFFTPNIILDWPKASSCGTDLYFGAYALPNAVYIQNLKDPATHALKSLGYAVGDLLNNKHHPLITL